MTRPGRASARSPIVLTPDRLELRIDLKAIRIRRRTHAEFGFAWQRTLERPLSDQSTSEDGVVSNHVKNALDPRRENRMAGVVFRGVCSTNDMMAGSCSLLFVAPTPHCPEMVMRPHGRVHDRWNSIRARQPGAWLMSG